METKPDSEEQKPIVLSQLQDHIGMVTMNNSRKLNSLSS